MKAYKAWVFLGSMLLSAVLFAQASPLPMLEQTANHIITQLKQHQGSLKTDHQFIYQAIREYLLPNVDVNGMARSVLGRQAWNQATLAEKQQFTDVFTQLVIRTYASPLAEYSDETIRFLPLRGTLSGRFLRVESLIIRSSGPSIPLSYSLVAKGEQWKIYDFSVEGVSLLQSFRSQFGQMLQNASMQDLIKAMRQKSEVS